MVVDTLERVHSTRANPRQFTEADLKDGALVKSDEFTNVAEVAGNTSRAYGAGFGIADQRTNNDGWADFDMKTTPDGGTTVNDAGGAFRFEVYGDVQKEDLIAYSGTFGAKGLRTAVAESRSDKALIPGMLSDVAGNDSYLVLAYRGAAGEEGEAVHAAGSNSELGIPYSELRTN